MSNIYQLESKKLEERYGPAIAQFICDELEKSERLEQQFQAKREQTQNKGGYIYKAA